MANRRPIRAPRQGWRRGRRRPTSWHDCFSVGSPFVGGFSGCPWEPLSTPGVLPGPAVITTREIIAGDIDARYLDREEVRIDRIVGDIGFYTASAVDAAPVALPPVVRWGLVLEEDPQDVSTTITTQGYDLWSSTPLGDLEWMHLSEPKICPNPVALPGDSVTLREFYWHDKVDVRVRRKLGKTDRVWLVMTYGNGTEAGGTSTNNWGSPVYHRWMARTVLVA